jgi:hypothetical protein
LFEIRLTHPNAEVSAKSSDIRKSIKSALEAYVKRFGNEFNDVKCTLRVVFKDGTAVKVDREYWAEMVTEEVQKLNRN